MPVATTLDTSDTQHSLNMVPKHSTNYFVLYM